MLSTFSIRNWNTKLNQSNKAAFSGANINPYFSELWHFNASYLCRWGWQACSLFQCFRPDAGMSCLAVPCARCHVSATPAGPRANSPWETSRRPELLSVARLGRPAPLQRAARPASAARWTNTAQQPGHQYSDRWFPVVVLLLYIITVQVHFILVSKPLSAAASAGHHLHRHHHGSARGQRSEHPGRGRRSAPPWKIPRCYPGVKPPGNCFSGEI